MHTQTGTKLAVILCTGILLGWVTHVNAGGRVSSSVPRAYPGQVVVYRSNGCTNGTANGSHAQHSGYGCHPQHCGYSTNRHGSGCGCHGCYQYNSAFLNWLLDDTYYSRSPDHGWNKVSKHPINRAGIVYQNYRPARWYGQAHSGPAVPVRHYPTIATPTDTTQLGYYYQHVPQWQPNPSMLPPRPWPPQWHNRDCPPRGPCRHSVWTPTGAPAVVPTDPRVPPAPTAPPAEQKSGAKTAGYPQPMRRLR